ncbi:patatin-like phospholipase family protein [Rubinisphaera margarita]|uniref:patatin-like phospholipase family protein n=1 Tax=Rubinisphaera margarita TaxID=2909586 RepID=UPI001EE89166|nr:patatin-like phospholipase family protein [Rubinisphaera margarita]MCG6154183.1 patatin-like phospholipase family protein [Rubinisphaera margarita]
MSSIVPESEVFAAELEEVQRRREKVAVENGSEESQEASAESADLRNNLIGLALSGGGIRSAAFNLGLIQAFHRTGLLRVIDYVSSVSGGSYVNAALAQSISRKREFGEAPELFDFYVEDNGRSSPAVTRLTKQGNYLFRLDLVANRYVIGLLLNLIPRISLLVAVCAFIAFVWRSLDYHQVRDHFEAWNLAGDVYPALAPSLVFGGLWFALCILALAFQSSPLKKLSHYVFWGSFACLVIGVATLIVSGDISLSEPYDPARTAGETRIFWQSYLQWPLLGMVLIGLIPILVPTKLFRSGVHPRNSVESWVFYYTSFALFLGVPLLLVAAFASENISGFATYRGPDFVYGDFKELDALGELIDSFSEERAKAVETPVVEILAGLDQATVARRRWLETTDDKVVQVDFSPDAIASGGASRQENTGEVKENEQPQSLFASSIEDSQLLDLMGLTCKDYPALKTRYDALLDAEGGLRLEDAIPLASDLGDACSHQLFVNEPARIYQAGTGAEEPLTDWMMWRYVRFLNRLKHAIGAPLQLSNNYSQFVASSAIQRKLHNETARCLNEVLDDKQLFTLTLVDPGTHHGTSPQNPRLAHLLELVASDEDGEVNQSQYHDAELNRLLFEEFYPAVFRPRSEIRRAVLIEHDQRHRLIWSVGALLAFLLSSALISPNNTSLHDYYRDRLCRAYLDADSEDAHSNPPLTSCQPHICGGPYPLFHGAVSVPSSWMRHPDHLAPDFHHFLLSPLFFGSRDLGYQRTDELGASTLTVGDTMAISAAAISPNYFVHHFIMLMMELLNFRTGKWIPSPQRADSIKRDPRLIELLWEGLANRNNEKYVLVTDGGHIENLGLEALIERRCRVIFVSDAGQDPYYCFDDFSKLVKRLRIEQGIEILEMDSAGESIFDDGYRPLQTRGKFPVRDLPGREKLEELGWSWLSLEQMQDTSMPQGVPPEGQKPDAVDHPENPRHFFFARIRYPEPDTTSDDLGSSAVPGGREALLVYFKPCLTGDEDLTIREFALRNYLFPHDPLSDQAFSFAQFDAYRQLGLHTAIDLVRGRTSGARGDLDSFWTSDRYFNADTLAEELTDGKWNSGTATTKESSGEPINVKEIREKVSAVIADLQRADDEQTTGEDIQSRQEELERMLGDSYVAADLIIAALSQADADVASLNSLRELHVYWDRRCVDRLLDLLDTWIPQEPRKRIGDGELAKSCECFLLLHDVLFHNEIQINREQVGRLFRLVQRLLATPTAKRRYQEPLSALLEFVGGAANLTSEMKREHEGILQVLRGTKRWNRAAST